MIVIGTALPLLVAVTGMWDPFRWGMYFHSMREGAPIAFYGQVVDEQAKPLKGAQVRVQIGKHNWAFILGAESTTTSKYYDLVTDAQGRFQINNKRGRYVIIDRITLPGYRFKPRIVGGGNWDVGFFFAGAGVGKAGPHKPDPNKPVTFDMAPTMPR